MEDTTDETDGEVAENKSASSSLTRRSRALSLDESLDSGDPKLSVLLSWFLATKFVEHDSFPEQHGKAGD